MDLKREFLHDQFLFMSISASLQHAGLYKEKISGDERDSFRDALKKKLLDISAEYEHPVSEFRHIQNIESLVKMMSDQFGGLFMGGRYRIGLAQKALNLYLKYLWCSGEISTPPHCPFDRMIIQKMMGSGGINWTDMDDIDNYRKLVAEAKNKAQGTSIAEWELQVYQIALAESREKGDF